MAFSKGVKNRLKPAGKLTLPASRKAHGTCGGTVCFLLLFLGWRRRSLVVHSFNKHSFLVPEEGSEGEEDMVPVLMWLII